MALRKCEELRNVAFSILPVHLMVYTQLQNFYSCKYNRILSAKLYRDFYDCKYTTHSRY